MTKKTIIYIAVSLAWTACCLTLSGGESAIAPVIITTVLTAPVGILLWFLGHLIPGEVYVPLALVLNYFQWKLFIAAFRKVRDSRASSSINKKLK